jgi:hypothetical protein
LGGTASNGTTANTGKLAVERIVTPMISLGAWALSHTEDAAGTTVASSLPSLRS